MNCSEPLERERGGEREYVTACTCTYHYSSTCNWKSPLSQFLFFSYLFSKHWTVLMAEHCLDSTNHFNEEDTTGSTSELWRKKDEDEKGRGREEGRERSSQKCLFSYLTKVSSNESVSTVIIKDVTTPIDHTPSSRPPSRWTSSGNHGNKTSMRGYPSSPSPISWRRDSRSHDPSEGRRQSENEGGREVMSESGEREGEK